MIIVITITVIITPIIINIVIINSYNNKIIIRYNNEEDPENVPQLR